ncbi:nicotinamide riboside transporter PnuC [Spiroplasma chrysopicola]|uniref:Nicotinamide mononucleotide transporter PnuC n=1 Tax=Spiroplasma chrysopicola DF-1 TaxID=1276227 RepID=R4UG06_9MOLU|nr:nicotinamide riboside transporter PnuC [Spiroplasma chrysopicola]AGM25080.1 nicotinamide mononucleotide transporter PnuC [Spiroplasma chrysopicola DF-1]
MQHKNKQWFTITRPINFLGVKTIIQDIKELPKIYKVLLIIVGGVVTFLSFFDFNHLINSTTSPSFFTITNVLSTPKVYLGNIPKLVDALLYCLSGFASFTGILNVFLISLGKMSTYFWGLINAIIFGLFAFDFGYTGTAQLNLFFYIPFQFLGWYCWQRTLVFGQTTSVQAKKTTWWIVAPFVLGACAVLAVPWYYEIPAFHYAIVQSEYAYVNQLLPHLFDSLANSFAIIACLLMFLRIKEQWILWIILNVLQFSMFSGLTSLIAHQPVIININILIQTIFFIGNSVIGLMAWNNKTKSKLVFTI